MRGRGAPRAPVRNVCPAAAVAILDDVAAFGDAEWTIGLALAVAPFLIESSIEGHRRSRERVRDEVDATTVGLWPAAETVGVSCGDDRAALRAIGDITAVAPWGEQRHARPDARGEAVFAAGRSAASGPWHFVAPKSNLALDWYESEPSSVR